MELFLDQQPLPFEFEKNAAEVTLPEDPNAWTNEILQELYKQVSYISDFNTHVVLDRVDAEKGYAFGHVLVSSKSEAPAGAPPEQEQAAGIQQGRIPIIVKERKLQPFDVLVTPSSKMLPLTEQRMRQALFRPQIFDVTSKTPGDISMIGQLYPPYRQNYGFGGGGAVVNMGMGKTGSASGIEKLSVSEVGTYRRVHKAVRNLVKDVGVEAAEPRIAKLKQRLGAISRESWKKPDSISESVDGLRRSEVREKADEAINTVMVRARAKQQAKQRALSKQANVVVPESLAAAGFKAVQPGILDRLRGVGRNVMTELERVPAAMRSATELPHEARDTLTKARDVISRVEPKLQETADEAARARRLAMAGLGVGAAGVTGAGLVGLHGVQKAREMEQALKVMPQYQKAQAEVAKEGQAGPAVEDDDWLQRKVYGTPVQPKQPSIGTPPLRKVSSVLSAILPTISERDFVYLAGQLNDPDVKLAFLRNQPGSVALERLSHYQPVDREKRAMALARSLRYDTAQVSREAPGQYRLKVASHSMWAPVTRSIDRGELVQLLGTKVALAVDQSGSVTLADGAAVGQEGPEASRPEPVKDFGLYRVETTDGRSLVGYVFPNLIDVDGTSLPLALFTNGSEYAMQSDICGVRAGEGQAIPEGRPRGQGVLFRVLSNGKAEATVPLDIKTSLDAGEGVQFMATSFSGEQVRLVPAPNVTSFTAVPGGGILVPQDMRWLTLDGAKEVQLAEAPEQMGQKQAASRRAIEIEIRSGGPDSFSLSGMPVEKLGYDATQQLGPDDAAFLLAGYGIQPEHAFKKLGEALYAGRPVAVPIGRMIKTASERYSDAASVGQQILDLMPQLRQPFLVKEAATIPDTTAVDTVLSLGFINPENMLEFLKAMPVLDDAQSRMCELLIAARLGLKEVPTGALEKAIKATENVIEGLRVIAFQEN